jgi:hypothetical protein
MYRCLSSGIVTEQCDWKSLAICSDSDAELWITIDAVIYLMLNQQHRSIANISEQDLVRQLVERPDWKSDLLEIHGIPQGSKYKFCVPLKGLTGTHQGDVDILLSVPGSPELATAIEVKRVKVSGKPLKINKLGEVRKGVQQANALSTLGFFQVYFYVLVLVDSRELNDGNYTYDELSANMTTRIEAAVSPLGLNKRVGMVHF